MKILEKTYEIRINALWRMQQMRGFIDGKTHQLTPWGRALVASINKLSFEDEGLIQALYVGFELFRMKALTSKNFVPSFSGAPANGSGILASSCGQVRWLTAMHRAGQSTHIADFSVLFVVCFGPQACGLPWPSQQEHTGIQQLQQHTFAGIEKFHRNDAGKPAARWGCKQREREPG